MEKHLKNWLAHMDSPPGITELRRALSPKYVVHTKDPEIESYVTHKTDKKLAGQKRTHKQLTQQSAEAIGGAAVAGTPPTAPTVIPDFDLVHGQITPGNAHEVGRMLANM